MLSWLLRTKKTPTPSEVELEIVHLLRGWGDDLQTIHEGYKQYQAVLMKKSRFLNKKLKGRSPLTIQDHRILQDPSLKAKYHHYKKYNTLKTKLKTALQDFESTPAQRDTGPVKSNRARGMEEGNTFFTRDEYQQRSGNIVHQHLVVGAFHCSSTPMIESTTC